MKHNKYLLIGLLGLALLLSSQLPRVQTVQAAAEPIPNAPIEVAQVQAEPDVKPVKETPDEYAKYQAQFANWPIVAQWTEPDGTTYTFRQAPPGYKPDPADLEADCSTLIPASENATLLPQVRNDVALATVYNCQWVTDSYGTAQLPVWKDGYRITQFVDTWAFVYCHNQDCVKGPIFFKLKANPKAWWTRTSTKWTVANAVHTWGNYSSATRCNGDTYGRILEGGFTVDWYNNTQSWVYKWPMPNPSWVAITEQIEGSWPFHKVTADVKYNGVKVKTVITGVMHDRIR